MLDLKWEHFQKKNHVITIVTNIFP